MHENGENPALDILLTCFGRVCTEISIVSASALFRITFLAPKQSTEFARTT
jgi:hypothetical protein